jgi:hypothetical protein
MQTLEVGQVYGRLTVIELTKKYYPSRPQGRDAAICLCSCENTEKIIVSKADLFGGKVTSCGCYRSDRARAWAGTEEFILKRGQNPHRLTTNAGFHPHYGRWHQMMERCYNKNHIGYKYYGARGITVYVEWHDPAVFCAWMDANMGPCPEGESMDRIDNDKGYGPDNVKWSTDSEQAKNKRFTPERAAALAEVRSRSPFMDLSRKRNALGQWI